MNFFIPVLIWIFGMKIATALIETSSDLGISCANWKFEGLIINFRAYITIYKLLGAVTHYFYNFITW